MAVRQWMSRALGLIGLTALATACTDDGVSLHTICPIPPDVSEDGCTWDSGSTLCVAEGVLNLHPDVATQYRLNLKVESGLTARARDVPPLGETNGLQITHAKVEIRNPDGKIIEFRWTDDQGKVHTLDNPFSVSASGYLAPRGTAIVPVVAVGPEYIEWLRTVDKLTLPQIAVAVQLHGTTAGSQEVESDEFSWPITLIDTACIAGIKSCASTAGQDGFALACGSR
jgi:hypothetical protein